MGDELPWDSYEKDRLPSGWSYPVGRDLIEHALRDANAHVDSLHLSMPSLDRGSPWLGFVLWQPDIGRYFRSNDARSAAGGRVTMSWNAIPGDQRQELGPQIEATWLRRACEWAAAAGRADNVWTASEHRLSLGYENGVITATES